MKKRSLFAAVAMLIVSALVLTSATYAWFATGGPALMEDLGGNVANVSAGVFLKSAASSALWKNSLEKTDLVNGGGSFVSEITPATDAVYLPMSTSDPNADDPSGTRTIFGYNLEGTAYKARTELQYDMYEFYVAAANEDNDDVEVKLNVTGAAAIAARVMVYVNNTPNYPASGWQAVTDSNSNTLYFSGAAEVVSGTTDPCWKPLVASLGNDCVDSKQDYIVKSGESTASENDTGVPSGALAANAIPVMGCPINANLTHGCFTLTDVHTKGASVTTNGTTTVNPKIRVFVWIEGQDKDCVPQGNTVPGGALDIDWYFRIANESWPDTMPTS